MLDTIDDKLCKVIIEADEKHIQQTPHQAQSPNNIENGEEFAHLVKLSIPLHLSSLTDLKFKKMRLTLAETREDRAVNLMLPRPYQPALTSLPSKHETQVFTAAIHTVLRRHVFDSHESENTICEQFQIALKKLYEALTGKHYDPIIKLNKAEKAKKEAEERLKKLKTMDTKEDQNKKTEKTASISSTQATVVMDTEEMPQLMSLDEEEQPTRGAKKKHFVLKKPTNRKPRSK